MITAFDAGRYSLPTLPLVEGPSAEEDAPAKLSDSQAKCDRPIGHQICHRCKRLNIDCQTVPRRVSARHVVAE